MPSLNMAGNISPRTVPASDQNISTGLWQRYEAIKGHQTTNNALMEELLIRYDVLSAKHTNLDVQYKQLSAHHSNIQAQMEENNTFLQRIQNYFDRDPFVLVLIDGDGMIFHESLLTQGQAGGRVAAAALETGIANAIRHIFAESGFPPHYKTIARIYANVKGLADVCHRAGLVSSPNDVEDFYRGFTSSKGLFDFVDVGPGKGRADTKVAEHFKLHVYNNHCRQIFFGCSHDNRFARTLEEILPEPGSTDRITLLEGTPLGKELSELPYRTYKIEGLFRSQKINMYQHCNVNGNGIPKLQHLNPGVAPFPAPLRPTITSNFESLPRSASTSSLNSDTRFRLTTNTPPPKKEATGWAAIAQKAAALPEPDLTPAASPSLAIRSLDPLDIPRNRKGQRIDPPTPEYLKDEVSRLKKAKLCNVHFLKPPCLYGSACTHEHNPAVAPTKKELETLKLVARMAPCTYGSGCLEPKCIYGHRCPAPAARDRKKLREAGGDEKGKNCIFGGECRFPEELHSMDCTVVKTTVVKG